MNLWTHIKLWFSKPKVINLESSTNNFNPWTASDVQTLMQLSEDGITDEEISIILNRRISAVLQKRRKIKLRK
jgi:uncharacterized membrane-anchored protein